MKTLLRWLLRILYRFRAHNAAVLDTPGPVLLLPNHVSWWDWLLIGVCLEDDWRFVTSSTTAEVSWFHRRIMINRRTFPVDMNSPFAVKRMAEYLQNRRPARALPGRPHLLHRLADETLRRHGLPHLQDPGQGHHRLHPRRAAAAVFPEPRPQAMVPAPVGSLQRPARAALRSNTSAPPQRARASPTGCATR